MTNHDPRGWPAPGDTESGSGEYERLSHTLSLRFAPHVQGAASLVRSAEQELADAQERLRAARDRAAGERYRSDPLVFMRASVKEEVAALDRKTTEKKVRAAFRYLVDRAVELADGEVQGFVADQAAARTEREQGVAACTEVEREAAARLTAARDMQDRVLDAQQQAHEGLGLMMRKLTAGVDDT